MWTLWLVIWMKNRTNCTSYKRHKRVCALVLELVIIVFHMIILILDLIHRPVFCLEHSVSKPVWDLWSALLIWAQVPLYIYIYIYIDKNKQTPWSESASELYRPSDRRLSLKWLPTFADRGCHVVSVTDPYGRILGFLDRSRYFSSK
jgi:hypothetical protein